MVPKLLLFISNHKKLILTYFSILILIPLISIYFSKNKKIPQTAHPISKTINQSTKSSTITQDHPLIFATHLEFQLDNQKILTAKTQKLNGDLPPLLSSPPTTTSANQIIYRVEVLSGSQTLLQNGWGITSQNSPTKPIIFEFFTIYQPKATVNLYYLDKLIWSTKMP